MMGARVRWIILVSLAMLVAGAGPSQAGPFVAYSLREAEQHAKSAQPGPKARLMAGMTRIVGGVYDRANSDLIVVGQGNPGEQKITLDHLVVALRSLLVHHEWPLVSIDNSPQTRRTHKQIVRFNGGIENTAFGKDLLEADIILKKLGLGLLPTEPVGIRSYFDLRVDQAKENAVVGSMASRFWFYPMDPVLAVREDVFAIQEVRVGVRTEVLGARFEGKSIADLAKVHDKMGDCFAASLTENYNLVSAGYPEINRLRVLLDLAALSWGVNRLPAKPDLRYWLRDYDVRYVETPADYPVLKRESKISGGRGTYVLQMSGGVELKALVLRLEDGDVTALKEAVLKSRPGPHALAWRVPLEGWHIPGSPKAGREAAENSIINDPMLPHQNMGCSIMSGLRRADVPALNDHFTAAAMPGIGKSLPTRLPEFSTRTTLLPSTSSPVTSGPRLTFEPVPGGGLEPRLLPAGIEPDSLTPPSAPFKAADVGGILLRADPKAELSEIRGAVWDDKGHQLSLVLSSGTSSVPIELVDDWRAILLSVYGGEDPGISIDPGPTRNVMLVRTIGRVRGTRLAKVMLEADRLLKNYSLGRDNRTGEPMNPDIPGYNPLVDIIWETGLRYNGALTRTWFVPRPVPISEARGRLCFGEVQIEARTEYDMEGLRGEREPAAKRYAQFFTDNYEQFAELHAELGQLKEYAKLVALAKYLRQEAVPLNWLIFALPCRQQPIECPPTEMGYTIGAEETGGLQIWGGVQLGTGVETQYDLSAMPAATLDLLALEAYAAAQLRQIDGVIEPGQLPALQAELENQPQTVLSFPARVRTTTGRCVDIYNDAVVRDQHGPILQLTRVQGTYGGEEFGRGWSLFVPYSLRPSTRTTTVGQHSVPRRITIEDQLSGCSFVLEVTRDKDGTISYRSDDCWWIRGVYPRTGTDGGWVMEDYWGDIFSFDKHLHLVLVDLGRDNRWAYEWSDEGRIVSICALPYSITLGPPEHDTPLGLVPHNIAVEDRAGRHILSYEAVKGTAVSYSATQGPWRVFVMTEGQPLRLIDAAGRTLVYDASGVLLCVERQPVPAPGAMGYWAIDLKYGNQGYVVAAELAGAGDVYYAYNDKGELQVAVDPRGWPVYSSPTPAPQAGPHVAWPLAVALVVVVMGITWYRRHRGAGITGARKPAMHAGRDAEPDKGSPGAR